jgi:uncharacterized damage-inducible protein DinB
MSVSPTVRDAWEANARVNGVLLEHLTPEMLEAQTPGGGDTVAQHLAHILNTVQYWGSLRDEPRFKALPNPIRAYDEATETITPETDLERLADIKRQTEETALNVAELEPDDAALPPGEWESPHATSDSYLIHMMVHDAHHRGQMLLALKTAGHPLPDEDAMWGPWRGE